MCYNKISQGDIRPVNNPTKQTDQANLPNTCWVTKRREPMEIDRYIRLGIRPLLLISMALSRADAGTHFTMVISSFSYHISFGLSVTNPEEN